MVYLYTPGGVYMGGPLTVSLREAGLLERPRGGHRGERVFAAKGRVRTLAMRVDD